MKAVIIILASLMGHALAAPASGKCNPGSRQDICLQASNKVYFKCLEARHRDETPEGFSERCKKERADSKKDCLDDRGVNETIRKKKAECANLGVRASIQCRKDNDKKSVETREDCEKKKKDVSAACIKGEQVKPVQAEPTNPSQGGVTKPPKDETEKPPQEEVTKPPKDETEKPPQEVTEPTQEEVTKPTQEQATPNDPSESESTKSNH